MENSLKKLVLGLACLASVSLAACERDPVLLRTSSRAAIDASVLRCSPNGFQTGGTFASPTCACLPGFVGNGFECFEMNVISECTPGADTDVGTASFTITHLGIPFDGFNLDGLNNATPPSGVGSTVTGCGKIDITGGIDNALASIGTSILDVLDLPRALQASLAHTEQDGGLAGPFTVLVVLSHLAPGNAANDSCIQADLVVSAPGQPVRTAHGSGAMVNNIAHVLFEGGISWPLAPEPEPSMCLGGVCNPATLELPIRGLRGRFVTNSAHTDLMASSILGGFTFVVDCTAANQLDGCTDGIFASANTTGLNASLMTWGSAANVGPTLQLMLEQAFSGARDLHMTADGLLFPCFGPNTSATDKNSISLAISLDSL